MSAKIIDGKAISGQIKGEIAEETKKLKGKGIVPGLGFILVGDDPASRTYVRMKGKACEAVGFHSVTQKLPPDTTQAELMKWVTQFNLDPDISGFLVQLPLPDHLDETEVIEAVDPNKDVDCFNPYNVGRLPSGREAFAPCTPAGVIELLMRSGYDPAGRHVVIVGRSSIVGRPLATLLSRKAPGGNATVTLCHSRSGDLTYFLKQADIVVAAIGSPEMIHGDMIKPGCVVIDVGVNRVEVPKEVNEKGYRLVGDVHFDSAREVAEAITPVPGGVGPMTIAMLLKNTLRAAQRKA
ncbi:bifunctional 5,10-methylene-tetrahydrofolate dehydrogenase/5,10-methylene-tetrahydrofolate cyclohydrolase [candidate division LCP-89 bacterium B3_LCP]|uniref:Bifunctional protein FolD n=1 Tax=candidate division LCP-89 bacterium B3_LCP TaxID=2012998 RepID=A0A532V3C9_UNCL8|nr:MAG: bifunctional 5,10-methylene-tetrahydrofolate dehydrogenase/5,10-methylene-tetrahydrofolate cyclohydrolase [candidate division LCP-89 bacterium B3_LCP]